MKSCHKKRARMYMQQGGMVGDAINKIDERQKALDAIVGDKPATTVVSPTPAAQAAPAPVPKVKSTADVLRDAQAASAEAKRREAELYAAPKKKKQTGLRDLFGL